MGMIGYTFTENGVKMCREYFDDWKEAYSVQNFAEFAADDVVMHLAALENAKYGFEVSDSFRNKVSMLSARMQRIAEEISALDQQGDNV